MTRTKTDRSTTIGSGRCARMSISLTRWLVAGAVLLALSPSPIHAQFGGLKKLKNKLSAPDSATRAKDSLEQIAAGVKPESVKVGKGLLQRTAAVVSTANGAIESATGISAKDAALAATGVGASNLVAKKLGLDPMSIGAQAIANAKMNAQQRAMQKATGATGVGVPGMSGMTSMGAMDAAQIQAMRQAAMANAASGRAGSAAMGGAVAGNAAVAGLTQADVDALVAFQQEMLQLSMAASAGDAKATARLQAWEALALKYQAETQKLSIAASAGDMAALERIQRLQFDMIREWSSPTAVRGKAPKVKTP